VTKQYGAGTLRKDAGEVRAILQKYGIDTARLDGAAAEYEDFKVTVPFIGAFNTGKSSAINALLGINLLPSSITANTTVPTEIVYGGNTMTVCRGDSIQAAGLHELRDRTLDLTGVTMLHLELDSELLKRLPGVKMVDMPGLDSGIAEHDRAMRGYLPNSLAYILMFSADEPVVKKSVAEFLSELGLREMPVYVVVTKCDKVPERDAETAAEYLKATVEKLLGLGDIQVRRIKAKADRDVAPLEELLGEMEQKADGMRDGILAGKLLDCIVPAEGYIKQRLAGERLSVSELEGRIDQLQRQGERIAAAVENEEKRFADEKERAVESVRRQVFVNLRECKSALLSTLLSGAEAWPQADRLIISVLAAGVPSELTTALRRHLQALSAIMDTDLTAGGERSAAKSKIDELLAAYAPEAQEREGAKEEQPPRFELEPELHAPGMHDGHRLIRTEQPPAPAQRAERPARPQGLDPAAKAVLDRFLGTRQVFDGMPRIPVQATRAAREKAAQEALVDNVLPQLLSMAGNCVSNGADAVSAQIHDAVQRAIESDYAVKQQALEDIRREKTREDSRREARLMDMETDLGMLEIIARGLAPETEGGGGDGAL